MSKLAWVPPQGVLDVVKHAFKNLILLGEVCSHNLDVGARPEIPRVAFKAGLVYTAPTNCFVGTHFVQCTAVLVNDHGQRTLAILYQPQVDLGYISWYFSI
ncbi:hypothetical protein PsorP6_006865 [Peronosclerospora sorghi]|uniref:Uncharacterized protein n=1 Tax=Peronosclerospora sorghi TaxID=230839 RepID=A0ACC0W6E1_9STRA|nr:hypothetical protein PsorP6_006865 [Peronosclerospora sorghi]